MATRIIGSFKRWSGSRDNEGHREYKITFIVQCGAEGDGPATALATTGLPAFGSTWNHGTDVDAFAYCQLEVNVTPRKEGKNNFFDLEYTYSTKPIGKACKDVQIENPLLQPQEVSGGDESDKEEGVLDRFGNPIVTSSHEPFKGHNNEWKVSFSKVTIKQNVAVLDLAFCEAMRNTVNSVPMWGLPTRTVKMQEFSWEKKFYGTCLYYYERKFEFHVKPKRWDRDFLDEGAKALNGAWNAKTGKYERKAVGADGVLNPDNDGVYDPNQPVNPNPRNPQHFLKYKDRKGENCRTVLQDGLPYVPPDNVTTCPSCPDGMPRILTVVGFEDEFTLVHSAECIWLNDDPSDPRAPTLQLQTGEAFNTWVFTLDDPGVFQNYGEWVLLESLWNCNGPNVLARDTGIAGAGPAFIGLAEKQVSSVHVEKHLESNFLLLGIPTVL